MVAVFVHGFEEWACVFVLADVVEVGGAVGGVHAFHDFEDANFDGAAQGDFGDHSVHGGLSFGGKFGVFFDVFGGLLEVGQKLGDGFFVVCGDGEVQAGWELLAVDVPASGLELVGDGVDVDVFVVGGDADDGSVLAAEDFEAGDFGGAVAEGFDGVHVGAGELQISVLAEGHEGGPCGGDGAAGASAGHAGGNVDAAGPVGGGEELVFEVGHVAVENDGRAFGGVAVFVEVGGYGGDAGDAEVKGGDVVAEFFHPGGEKTAEAGVDVEGDFEFLGYLADFGDGVDHAVGVLGCGGGDEDGVSVDEFSHGFDVDLEVFVDGCVADFHAEVVCGFFEGDVDGAWGDDFGFAGADFEAASGAFAGGFDGHEDGFCAAGGHGSDDVFVAVEHVGGHADDVGFHLFEALEGHGVEGVFAEEQVVGLFDEL